METLRTCGKIYDFDIETEHYKTETGAEVHLIKVNLPATREDEKEGNGEGVFLQVDDETKAAYDDDTNAGRTYTGILDNDAMYFPEMQHGLRVPITTRGASRPVIPYKWANNYSLACRAWERGEQAQGKNPEDYAGREDYLRAKMEYYEFIDDQEEPALYDMQDWRNAGTFSAKPGQRITAEVYEEMLNVMPPLDLPRETAEKALHSYGVPVHSGFLMGEPADSNAQGLLYRAFGSNDYGKGRKYYYLGLSHRENLREGVYYFFDCLDGIIGDYPYTAEEIRARTTSDPTPYTEKELIHIAANHEATLSRQEYRAGELIRETVLYNPWTIYEKAPGADQDTAQDDKTPTSCGADQAGGPSDPGDE